MLATKVRKHIAAIAAVHHTEGPAPATHWPAAAIAVTTDQISHVNRWGRTARRKIASPYGMAAKSDTAEPMRPKIEAAP